MTKEKFLAQLQPNLAYRVYQNRNYDHVRPSEMTQLDINELYARWRSGGDKALVEGAMNYNNLLLG